MEMHWSIYNNHYDAKAKFLREAERCLLGIESACMDDAKPGAVERYCVLPNFWEGFRGQEHATDPDFRLASGSVTIRVEDSDASELHHHVEYRQEISGECELLDYVTNRVYEMNGAWTLSTRNDSGGIYTGCHIKGQVGFGQDDGYVRSLFDGNNPIETATALKDRPLICLWSLFRLLPTVGARKIGHFSLVDDFERVSCKARVIALPDRVTAIVGDRKLSLKNYCVLGTGFIPTYWWIDEEHHKTVLMSSLYLTYVHEGLYA